MTEVSSNISWDLLDTKEKVSMLQKLNSCMPTQLIEDLVNMYDAMNEEQRKKMEENVDNPEVQFKSERVPDDVPDAVTIMNFDTIEESDEFLVKEGKLPPEELEKNKIFEIFEDYEYDSNAFEKVLENK